MSRKFRQPLQCDAGFTLVELLVTLALVGLLTAALFGGLRFGARATDRATTVTEHSSQLALAYGFLRAQLGNVQPFPAEADPKDQEIIFDGASDQIDAVTTAPSRLAVGGFFRLRLAAAQDGELWRLIAQWQSPPRRGEGSLETVLEPVVLLDRLRAIRFAYFGATDPADPADWHDSWQAVTILPKMIRLRVQFADGRRAPDLTVAPRLAEEPNSND